MILPCIPTEAVIDELSPTRSGDRPLPARTTTPLQLAVQRIRQFQHNTIHHASLLTSHAAHRHPEPPLGSCSADAAPPQLTVRRPIGSGRSR